MLLKYEQIPNLIKVCLFILTNNSEKKQKQKTTNNLYYTKTKNNEHYNNLVLGFDTSTVYSNKIRPKFIGVNYF